MGRNHCEGLDLGDLDSGGSDLESAVGSAPLFGRIQTEHGELEGREIFVLEVEGYFRGGSLADWFHCLSQGEECV